MAESAGQVLSFGAGVNSTALAILLINRGWRGSIVFADTGCEWPETYCFLDYFEREFLAPRGFEIVRLSGKRWTPNGADESLIAECERYHVIPLAAVRWCTVKYKIQPLEKWCSENGNPEQLLGIAADESERKPRANRPLVDLGITRGACVEIIKAAGVAVPQKSGCYICPFQRPSQWFELWRRHPDLFERALALEENTRRSRPDRRVATLDVGGKITLRQRRDMFERQIPMFDGGEWDDLLRYRPCVCGL